MTMIGHFSDLIEWPKNGPDLPVHFELHFVAMTFLESEMIWPYDIYDMVSMPVLGASLMAIK